MPAAQFPQTSWTRIARAGRGTPDQKEALSAFCNAYWPPVYAYIRRRSGCADSAHDRTQGFFARLLARNDLQKADRAHGSKFRSWLLKCVNNYLKNERNRPTEDLSADGQPEEPWHQATPERLYDRAFAMSLLARIIDELRLKYAKAGKEQLFDALKGCLSGDAAQRPYEEVAVLLGMGSVGAVKKAAFDLRAHFKRMVREEVACMVRIKGRDDVSAVNDELRQLLEALQE